MNKTFKCLVLMGVMLMAAMSVKAEYTSLTVKEQIGTWISYSLDGLKLTFGNNQMTLQNKEQAVTYDISALNSMEFTDLPSAIKEAGSNYTVVSLQGSTIKLNVKVGTMAKVYDTLGRLVGQARVGQEGVPVFIGAPQPGIYVIKAGDQKCKVLVK